MTTTKVALIQTELDAAKKEADAEQRERDLKTLRDMLKELKEAERAYKRMESGILAADGKRAVMTAEVSQLNHALTIHDSARPEYADLLPGDEETISWNRERKQIVTARDAAVAKLRAGVDGPTRQEALALANEIANLQLVTRNLGAKLRGEELGKGWQGGVTSVR